MSATDTHGVVYVYGYGARSTGVMHNGREWVWVQGESVGPSVHGVRNLHESEYTVIDAPTDHLSLLMADKAVTAVLMQAFERGAAA